MIRKVRSRLGSQTVLTAATGLGVYGLSALTGPLLAHALGAAGRGNLSAVQVPSQLFGFLLCFGLPEAAVYFAGTHSRRTTITVSWLFAVVVGGSMVAGLWWLVPGYLHGHVPTTVVWLRIMLVTMVVLLPVSVTVDLLRVRSRMTAFNAMRALPVVANTVFICGLDLAGRLDLTTALASAFAAQVLWYAVVLIGLRGWPSSRPTRSAARAEIGYGARLALGSLSELLVARLDQFLLVGVVAPRELGFYAVAVTAAGLSGPAAWGVAIVLFPRIRQAETPGEAWEATKAALRWTAASSVTFAAVIGLSAPVVLPRLFGSEFRASVVPLLLLLPGQVLFDLGNVVAQASMARNRPGRVSKAYLLAAVVTVGGLAAVIGPFGIRGAAAVTSISQAGYLAYLYGGARRRDRTAHAVAHHLGAPTGVAGPSGGVAPAPLEGADPVPRP